MWVCNCKLQAIQHFILKDEFVSMRGKGGIFDCKLQAIQHSILKNEFVIEVKKQFTGL